MARQLIKPRSAETCSSSLTLSLSTVFWDVREAMEMVSGWLLPSPWLSPSSAPSLRTRMAQTRLRRLCPCGH